MKAMQKIIRGVKYDTDSAIMIGGAQSDRPRNDFSFWEADLYRTPRSGRYFLAGEGGPMTRFGERVGHTARTGGSKIIPISREDAFEWASQNLASDTVEAEFGDMIEDA